MKFINHTKEAVEEMFERTAVLSMKDETYKAIHVQDGVDNLTAEDCDAGYTWYLDYEVKDFNTKPTAEDCEFEDGYGGMLLCKRDFLDKHTTWESILIEIIDMEDIKLEDVESVDLYYWER